jgi:hypothetical protein
MLDDVDALFDRTYLRWYDLLEKPALIQILGTEAQVEMTLPGGAKTRKPLLHYECVKGEIAKVPQAGNVPAHFKPLVLNATNGNSIAAIHGRKPSEWVGKEVVLFQDKVEMFDKTLRKKVVRDCIRIRAKK